LAQQWFRAEVVLAPVDTKKSISGSLAQFGGLASIAGINLPGGGEQEPVAVLKSNDFAESFIEDLGLMQTLTDGQSIGGSPVDIRDAVWVFTNSVRSVSEDKKTRLVTLSIRWKDPETAAAWANQYVKKLNDRLRREALEESQRNVTYLQREIAASSIVSLQQSMARVLEGEMQKLMLARGNEEFAFKIIDSASPPKLRDSPRRSLIAILSAFFGVLVGVLIALSRNALKTRPRPIA
jgi:LPS O-antigen subunit length determinant protein (WzzB/FepE family)